MPEKVRHVVQRLDWRAVPEGLVRLPGRTRLASFGDADEAEADRRRREDEARSRVNPFTCDGPALVTKTSLDEDRLHDWVLDLGLTPPKKTKGGRKWAEWWRKSLPDFTPLQLLRLWEAFDKLHFFEVVQRPERPLGYALVQVNWEYSDEYYYSEPEGGTVFTIYLDRERALSACEDHNDIGQDIWSEHDDEGFEDDPRLQVARDPLQPPPTSRRRDRKQASQVASGRSSRWSWSYKWRENEPPGPSSGPSTSSNA
jgi:hypothetical protein